jgi:hypothetical protein
MSSIRDDGATAIAEALNTNTCIRKFRKVGTNRRHAKALADQRCVDLVVTQMPKSTMTVRSQSRGGLSDRASTLVAVRIKCCWATSDGSFYAISQYN